MNVIDISEYILQYANNKGQTITNLKLQKILYYIQGYIMTKFDKPAFEDEFVHWQYGPTCKKAYFNYSINRSESIVPNYKKECFIPCEMKIVINKVIDKCLEKTVQELINMSISESPWKNSDNFDVISKNSIKEYFLNNNPLNI